MNYGLRGDGAVEDVDGDCPPQDGRVVGDDEVDDFPLREGSSTGGIAMPEGKSVPAQKFILLKLIRSTHMHGYA